MAKSAEAFRTISEVSEALDTPAHVLRFWESRFSQIKPVKRAGGRRYYRPSDVALLGGIKKLLHVDGLTIRGVQKILREQGVRHVSSLSDLDGLLEASADVPPMRAPAAAQESKRSAEDAARPKMAAPSSTASRQPDMFPQDDGAVPEAPMIENAPPLTDPDNVHIWRGNDQPAADGRQDRPGAASDAAPPGGPLTAPTDPPSASALPDSGPVSPAAATSPPPAQSAPDLSDDVDTAMPTLAARLRALPAAKVAGKEAELAEIYLRLHALKKRMAPPTQPRRN